MHVPLLIEKKREGGELTDGEIQWVISNFTSGQLPDYQMSALAMAIFFRGMSERETAALTANMRDSGRVFRWPEGSPPKVDKHSTGGIGDKTSLILAPLLACDNLWVPMVSGRGLGITGGTLDKLESLPGFRVHLSEQECLRQIEQLGVFMAGQTDDFCPADKRLYALRDVTGTVPSRALIIASIMAKKLAESLDRLVLDVKFGSGAFMKTREDAALLAAGLEAAGTRNGVDTSHMLTPMDEPLGAAVGNALEVKEAIACLQGGGPPDLRELVLDLAERVADADRSKLADWLDQGQAWDKFVRMVEAQGGDVRALERPGEFHPAPVVRELKAPRAGTVTRVDAGAIGGMVVRLGGGRTRAEDAIDFAVGFDQIRKCGSVVEAGETLLRLHARNAAQADEIWSELEGSVTMTP